MKRTPKTYAYGEKTDTEKKFQEEHDALLQKWNDDPDLKTGNLPQPNQSEKSIKCICGSHVTAGSKHNHVKTKKHLDFIEKNKTQQQTNEEVVVYDKNRRVHICGFALGGVEIVRRGNKCVYETCVRCNKEYPLTTLYFHVEKAGNTKTNYERKSGKEVMSNTPFYGCRECAKKVSIERSKTDGEYIRILLKSYPFLTEEWFISLPFICSISNLPLYKGQKESGSWTASIQNNKPDEEHTPENCCLIAREFNVQQQKAIPDLLEAWKKAFELIINEFVNLSNTEDLVSKFKQWYNNTPEQNGVNVPCQIIDPSDPSKKIKNPEYSALCKKYHLKTIFRDMINNNKHQDKKSKRDTKLEQCNLTIDNLCDKMLQQKCKCLYTGIPFSVERDTWSYFSIERLDNSKNHTLDNSVFVCRLFNTAAQLSRQKILTALLSQIHVPLSHECRIKIQDELATFD